MRRCGQAARICKCDPDFDDRVTEVDRRREEVEGSDPARWIIGITGNEETSGRTALSSEILDGPQTAIFGERGNMSVDSLYPPPVSEDPGADAKMIDQPTSFPARVNLPSPS